MKEERHNSKRRVLFYFIFFFNHPTGENIKNVMHWGARVNKKKETESTQRGMTSIYGQIVLLLQ